MLLQDREITRLNFDPRNLSMMPDAHLTYSETLQKSLSAIDLSQSMQSDRGPMRDARREAGQSRFVPGRQAECTRQFPHLDLSQVCIDQRRDDTVLNRRCSS